MPIRQREEARRRVCEEILLRRDEDGEKADAKRMGQEKRFSGQEKERERYCATLSTDVRQRRRAVRPPKESASVDGGGEEVLEEDDEDHELLGIDMGWGIHTILPETLKQATLEIDAPALVRRVRRHLQVTILHAKRPHRSHAMERPQRGYPREIPNRLHGQTDWEIDVFRKTINGMEIALEEAGMKADEGNGGNHRRQMAEENLEAPTRQGAGSHRRSASDKRRPLVLVDGDGSRRRIPEETEEAELLRWKQRRLREVDDEADALKEEKRLLHVRRALLRRAPENEDVVQIPNGANPAEMKKGLENLCHLREDERSEAEAKRQDPELPHPAFPAKAKEAAGRGSDGDVEVGVLEVDGRRPIPWTQEKGDVLHCVHTKMRAIDEELVEALQIDDRPPPHRLRDEEQLREEAWGGKRDLLDGPFPLQSLHLRVDEIHVILAREDGERRRTRERKRRRTTKGDVVSLHNVQNGGRSANLLPHMEKTSESPPN